MDENGEEEEEKGEEEGNWEDDIIRGRRGGRNHGGFTAKGILEYGLEEDVVKVRRREDRDNSNMW